MRVRCAVCGRRLDILNRRVRPAKAGTMTVKLNNQALKHARELIKAGKVVRDERDDWSEDALPAKKETEWLKKHSWD